MARAVLRRDNAIVARRLAEDALDGVFQINPNTVARHFLAHSPTFAATAGLRALAQSGLQAIDIDAVVVSTCAGYGGMVRADGGLTNLACCIRRDHLEASRRKSPGLSAGKVIESLLKEQCDGVKAALLAATL